MIAEYLRVSFEETLRWGYGDDAGLDIARRASSLALALLARVVDLEKVFGA